MKKFLLVAGVLLLTILLTFGATSALIRPTNPPATGSVTIQGLLNFTNKNRSTPLVLDERLNRSAQAKCADMVARNYYTHNTPDGVTPWVFIEKETGPISNGSWGENLETNLVQDATSKYVLQRWLDSPEHKANIQNPAYHLVGFGICSSPSYVGNHGAAAILVVQHFAS